MEPGTEHSARLEHDAGIVFVLDRDLRIVYCNEAWDTFARDNGGTAWERPHPYGRSLLDVIPDRLRSLYRTAYRQVFFSGVPWVHHYECSSAELYRSFRMTVTRNEDGQSLTVMNSLLEESGHSASRHAAAPVPSVHHDATGSITMCSVCRRTLRFADQVWEWVPDYVRQPPQAVVHCLCDRCENR